MAALDNPLQARAAPLADSGGAARSGVLARPVLVFVLLSLLFGGATIWLNPPLRAPDEPSHFLRAWGYAQGQILPAAEQDGRKGTYLPARLDDGFNFFTERQYKFFDRKTPYTGVYDEYAAHKAVAPVRPDVPPRFRVYEGSEGYPPAAYLPHIAGAVVADALRLDFLGTITLMRFAGLVVLTALTAYAVALAPQLKWAFVLIGLLPSALYGRAAVSADGAVLTFTMLMAATILRGLARGGADSDAGWRALWTTLSVLTKPPQIAFILLEAMRHPWREAVARWRQWALVIGPGIALTGLWLYAVGGEMAAWRIATATGQPAEHFELGWKLGFMAEHPLHFPRLIVATLISESDLYLKQLIGVLGWLDMPLRGLFYPLIGAALALSLVEPLRLDRTTRLRLILAGVLTLAGYWFTVYFVFFVTWTTTDAPQIMGVQGRYLAPALPVLAIIVGATGLSLNSRLVQGAALAGAVLSGIATLDAIWRPVWG